MRAMTLRMIVITNGTDYIVHGSNDQSSATMFKAIAGGDSPIWTFDPKNETAHYVETVVMIPELEKPEEVVFDDFCNDEIDSDI